MATQVSVLSASTGVATYYTTYLNARSNANAGDLIQVWADLTDEEILKDGVNIWIAPGRIIQMSNSKFLILDNDEDYDIPVTATITGNGIFKNVNNYLGYIRIFNKESNISIQCDSLENNAYHSTNFDTATVYVENAAKFHLTCKKIYNSKQSAIYFENEVNDVNIRAATIESGYYDQNYNGSDTIIFRGSGFLIANQVISNSNGSCLSHRAGNLTANILKLTTKANNSSTPRATVDVYNGTAAQTLTLNYDTIENLHSVGATAVRLSEGFVNLIGRRIFSDKGLSMDLSGDADIKAVEIISGTKGINIHNGSTQKIIIDANLIEGSNGNDGVIRSSSGSNYVIRNAKIKNIYTGSSSPYSRGIYIEQGSSANNQSIELENIIIVTGTGSLDFSIYRAGTTNGIAIKNLGLFVNVDKNNLVSFEIGTSTNFKYIISPEIT